MPIQLDGEDADVAITVEDRVFRMHRYVVEETTRFFDKHITLSMEEQLSQPPIEIPGGKTSFAIMCNWMYRKFGAPRLSTIETSLIVVVAAAAETLRMTALAEQLAELLIQRLEKHPPAAEVLGVLQDLSKYNVQEMTESGTALCAVFNNIRENITAFCNEPAITMLSVAQVEEILLSIGDRIGEEFEQSKWNFVKCYLENTDPCLSSEDLLKLIDTASRPNSVKPTDSAWLLFQAVRCAASCISRTHLFTDTQQE